jgi:hypothetical protein
VAVVVVRVLRALMPLRAKLVGRAVPAQTLFLFGVWLQLLAIMLVVLFGLVVVALVALTAQIRLLQHRVLVAGGRVLVVWVKTGLLILVVVVLAVETPVRPGTAVLVLL